LSILAVFAAGSANWLLGLQGFMVLVEGDTVPLFAPGRQMDGFEAGPLADPGEMRITLRLDKVELVPRDDGFVPEGRLSVKREGIAQEEVVMDPARVVSVGPLRLHQGAFGFAPRIVVLKDGATVFDETVPFTTRREGPQGVAFEGEAAVEAPDVVVRGVVDLEGLDERMHGHPRLRVELSKNGEVLGSGILRPGFFADVEGGWRVGFAGAKKWSEIDISRRNYAGVGLWVYGVLRSRAAARL
jgi:hypothetical protein